MKPPYTLTPTILHSISSISEKIGAIKAEYLQHPRAELRKANRIKTIQASLEIEGNTLSLEQVTDLLNDKRVLAPVKDILEVKNAIRVYAESDKLKPFSLSSFLSAHKMLMKGLIPKAGTFRTKGAGIVKGEALAHLAPPARMVAPLMKDLFGYVKNDPDPILIKSCVFHYEMEFIHPFADGNGRMGRLWQTVLLSQYSPVFAYLPVETLIKQKQAAYYRALNRSDAAGESTLFLEFMLKTIDAALEDLLTDGRPPLTAEDRLLIYQRLNKRSPFSRKDYLAEFRSISTATASRDLQQAVEKKWLVRKGDKRLARYEFRAATATTTRSSGRHI
jgi:Fic family protein